MDDAEAKAALLSLGGETLTWEQFVGRYIVRPSEGSEGLFVGSVAEPDTQDTCSYCVERTAGRQFSSFEASVYHTTYPHRKRKSENSPVHYKTLVAAKLACEQHRATGCWSKTIGINLTWSQASLPGTIPGSVISYLENENKVYYEVVPCLERRWRFWLPRAELYAVGIRHPKWTRNGYRRGKYKTLAEAKAACECHYATGKWE